MKFLKDKGIVLLVVTLWLTQWLLTGATITVNPVQPGTVIMVLTACPSGYDEVAALDGVTVRGTLAANGNVGTSGGSDLITPSGSVSAPTFTGDALASHSHTAGTFTAAAQTFTGSSSTVGAQTFTGSSSTVGAQTFTGSSSTVAAQTISWPAGVPTAANESAHTHSGSTLTAAAQTFTGTLSTVIVNHVHVQNLPTSQTGGQSSGTRDTSTTGSGADALSTANPTGGAASYTPAGTNGTSAVSGTSGAGSAHTHTLSWPAGVPTNGTSTVTPLGTNGTSTVTPLGSNSTSTVTPLGSNASSAVSGTSQAITAGTPSGTNSAPNFTGTQVANVQAFVRVIFCVKT